MKDLRFQAQYEKTSNKKKRRFSKSMILLFIFLGGLPLYTYLVLTGKMFEFEFIKKHFSGIEPIANHLTLPQYRKSQHKTAEVPPAPDIPVKKRWKPATHNPAPKTEKNEYIYSWVGEDGIKQFSNIKPYGVKGDIKITKALNSRVGERMNRKSSLAAVGSHRETPVIIENNRIMIPVEFGYNGSEHSTILVLDTGATDTTIYQEFADNFNIYEHVDSKATVADGSIVRTKIANFDYMIVGPYKMNNAEITIMDFKGNRLSKGLLGMNFLKHVNYQVDYGRNVIKWEKM